MLATYINDGPARTHKRRRDGREEQLLAPYGHAILGILHLPHEALHLKKKKKNVKQWIPLSSFVQANQDGRPFC